MEWRNCLFLSYSNMITEIDEVRFRSVKVFKIARPPNYAHILPAPKGDVVLSRKRCPPFIV